MSSRKDASEKIAKRYQNEEQMEKTFKWKPGFITHTWLRQLRWLEC